MRNDPSGAWWLPRMIMVFVGVWTTEVLAAAALMLTGWSP